MSEVLFRLILAFIPVLGVIITSVLIPWMKARIGAEKLATYTIWAEKAVRCAQQVYTPEQWREKKDFCMQYMITLCNGALAPAQIEILIEAAVKELKIAEGTIVDTTKYEVPDV